ncbi:MAG: putative sulfate exporter family transporter, partial [Woeseiaceae bacterium]
MTENLRSPGWWAGIATAVVISILAGYVASWMGTSLLGFEKSPISAIMMAIILGMLLANTVTLPSQWQPGLKFCTTMVLRIGIMLLGIRLSLLSAGQ